MEISEIADWFDDLDVSLKRIHENGICLQGDDDSSELEIEIISNGGLDGLLRCLERKALIGCDYSYVYASILSYVYDTCTILVLPEHLSKFTEYAISLIPKCNKCARMSPAHLDIASFRICEKCDQ